MTDIDICNLALVKVGSDPIVGFGDGTKQARIANLWYQAARDSMLRNHPWSWARVWLSLPTSAFVPIQLLIKPDPAYQSEIIFTGAYPLPADNLRVYRAAPFQFHFRIVGKFLYTDAPPLPATSGQFVGAQSGVGLPPISVSTNQIGCGIEYISRILDPGQFDTMFVEALAAKLAGHICVPLTGDIQLKESLQKEAQELMQEAWFVDGAENWPDELYDNTLTEVRNQAGAQSGGTDIF